MNSKINKSFILICFLLFYIPLLFVIVRVKVTDNYSNKKINGNFEKNFPLKDDFFSAFSYLKTNIFFVNPIPDKVIVLQDGWLFCGDSFSDNFSESKGFKIFSRNEIDTIKANFENKAKWFRDNNIDYFLAVPPNKETIYGDLISVKKYNSLNTKREQIDSLCKRININHIDLSADFPKNSRNILYHKTDTHWNELAGFYGYLTIINTLKLKYTNENLTPLELKDFKIDESKEKVGDLNDMLRREKSENKVILSYINNKHAQSIQLKNQLPIPIYNDIDPLFYESRYSSNSKKLKVMILSDSFGRYFEKFLRENFKETVFIFNQTIDKDLIKKENPDIIIQEILERNLDFFLESKN